MPSVKAVYGWELLSAAWHRSIRVLSVRGGTGILYRKYAVMELEVWDSFGNGTSPWHCTGWCSTSDMIGRNQGPRAGKDGPEKRQRRRGIARPSCVRTWEKATSLVPASLRKTGIPWRTLTVDSIATMFQEDDHSALQKVLSNSYHLFQPYLLDRSESVYSLRKWNHFTQRATLSA